MNARTLYDIELSRNCYKLRLFCALLGLELDLKPVDLMAGAHKESPFIDLNPFGQVPVLQDGDLVLRDSQAILVYLARKYGGETWRPKDPVGMASVVNWLMVAENEIARGPADARLPDKFGFPVDADKARENAANILGLLKARLTQHEWFALDRPTIADIACMPYVALGHEGGAPLDSYPAIRAWVDRIKALPGFVSMPAL